MNNKTILVTGASGGIGNAIATTLIENNYKVVLHYNSNKSSINKIINNYPNKLDNIRKIQFSIQDRDDCQNKIHQDIEKHGPYYGVVCNAGITRDNAFPAMPANDWDEVINTNLGGFYNVLHPTIMPMVRAKNGGRIITMSSVSGIMGNRGQVNYSASKGGLIAATKSLAIELAKRKITVNCIAPGIINTDMTTDIDEKIIKQSIPMQRAGTVNEVSSLVRYLISDEASYITRQVISVNGGMF